MTEIHLEIVGLPAPQGSKVKMPNGAMLDGTSKTGRANLAAWRTAVAEAARRRLDEHPAQPLAEPLAVSITFRFPLPATDQYRWRHIATPDVDKVVRSTFDSLVHGGLLADDRYVFKLSVIKVYAQEGDAIGASIQLIPMGAQEKAFRERAKAAAAERRKEQRRAASAPAMEALL